MTCDVDQLASDLNGDWRALIHTRANLLVTGPTDLLVAFGGLCREEMREPVICAVSSGFRLQSGRTLVLPDVHLLDPVAQHTLAAWMRDGQNANTQILSLAPVPLFSLVQLGQFDSDLYYRLNTIRLDLVGRDAHQAAI